MAQQITITRDQLAAVLASRGLIILGMGTAGAVFDDLAAAAAGPAGPELDPGMARVAQDIARSALRNLHGVQEWTECFATGDEEADRPLYREFRRCILRALVDLAQEVLRK